MNRPKGTYRSKTGSEEISFCIRVDKEERGEMKSEEQERKHLDVEEKINITERDENHAHKTEV